MDAQKTSLDSTAPIKKAARPTRGCAQLMAFMANGKSQVSLEACLPQLSLADFTIKTGPISKGNPAIASSFDRRYQRHRDDRTARP